MAETWNLRLIGHSDLGGSGDAMHVQLKDGHAFVGHMKEAGTSIVDVRDPARPRWVGRIPVGPNTHAHKVQIQGDVLLANRELIPRRSPPHEAGLAIFDVSDVRRPRQIGYWPCGGLGVHRMTWWEGPLAYVTAGADDVDGQFLVVLDLTDPARPREVGRWWLAGQHRSEPRPWDDSWRVKLHHAIVRDGLAYAAWWDAGLFVLDVRDPGRSSVVGALQLDHAVSRASHTFCPLPGRTIAVTTEERIVDGCTGVAPNARLVDIAEPSSLRILSTLPVPEGDWCERGGRFGPHNVHEPKPGTLIDGSTVYLTYFNAGLRVYDVSDPVRPTEIAFYVPDPPPGQPTIQLNDILVADDGLIYVTDRIGGGLYILELTAGASLARPRAA
ncbi:MAG TPA: hypothetical protein VNJ28_06495 [Candidatus Limnocylindrales bacterium]|nr:hypothetical protein [Candidatus Limnocylindrales bacterium]